MTLPLNVGETQELSDRLRQKLFPTLPQSWKLMRVGVEGDGSCYYHSLAALTNFNSSMEKLFLKQHGPRFGLTLRKMAHLSLDEQNWNSFWTSRNITHFPSFQKIDMELKNNSTWADLFACVYVFSLCNVDVVFIDMETEQKYCGPTGARDACRKCTNPVKQNENIPNGDGKIAAIAWVKHSHFEPIVIYKENVSPVGLQHKATFVNDAAIISLFSGKMRKMILEDYDKDCKRTSLIRVAASNIK